MCYNTSRQFFPRTQMKSFSEIVRALVRALVGDETDEERERRGLWEDFLNQAVVVSAFLLALVVVFAIYLLFLAFEP